MSAPRLARLPGGLALAALALYLGASLPQALRRPLTMLGAAAQSRHESSAAARARFAGAAYVAAIDAIRRTLGEDESYLLVDGGNPEDGDLFWVRFDLAPRQAFYLGELGELHDIHRLRQRLPARLRYVIVAYTAPRPPVLYERYRFVQQMARRSS